MRNDGADDGVDRLPAGVNLDRIEGIVAVEVSKTSADDLWLAQTVCDVGGQTGAQIGFIAAQGERVALAVAEIEVAAQVVDDVLLMHHPGEEHMLIGGAMQKVVEDVADVVEDHGFGGRSHLKGVGVPAPVAIEKDGVWQRVFQLLADAGLANAHGPTDEIELFHGADLHARCQSRRLSANVAASLPSSRSQER